MRMKLIAGCGFLLNTIFFATYYSVAKEALGRIDPIVFTFFEMISLVPAGLLIVLCTWKSLNRTVVKRGILLGSLLCLALFTIAIALKYTTATSTAFFPALNGFLAAIIAWMLFREPVRGHTWVAGILSLGGTLLLIFSSSGGNLRGTLIAFLGGIFYVGYVFLSDHEQKDEKAQWALFGIELLATATWSCLVVLLFGNWQAVHPILPKDVLVVLYVAIACTFLPTLITVLLQNYISPVTVSFIYILEPVLGALIAFLYLHERVPVQDYLGGGLVVFGAIIHTLGTVGRGHSEKKRRTEKTSSRFIKSAVGSWVSTLLYPGIGCILGLILLCYLGGVPPVAWGDVFRLWPQFSLYIQQGQTTYVVLLLVRAGGWLVAWLSVLLMGCMAFYHALLLMFQPAQLELIALPAPRQRTELLAPPATNGVVARSSLQPTRRVRTARTTVQLSEIPTRPMLPSSHVSEQITWYGEAIWRVSSTHEITSTGPLPSGSPPVYDRRAEPVPPRRQSMSVEAYIAEGSFLMEHLDAEKMRSL
jgi:drug/metabolite transporter (DMT)-like permease